MVLSNAAWLLSVGLYYSLQSSLGSGPQFDEVHRVVAGIFWNSVTPLILTNLLWIIVIGWWRFRPVQAPSPAQHSTGGGPPDRS
jgi:hypothetical protein